MDKHDYLQEGQRQISYNSHYELLEDIPHPGIQQPNTSGTTTSYKPQHHRWQNYENIVQQITKDPKLLYVTQNT